MVISILTIAQAPSLAQSPCHIHTWTLATNRLTNIQATPQSTPVCLWYYFESGSIFKIVNATRKCKGKERRGKEGRGKEGRGKEGRKREDDSA